MRRVLLVAMLAAGCDDSGGGGDCRRAGSECAAGFQCVDQGGSWDCVPGGSGGTSAHDAEVWATGGGIPRDAEVGGAGGSGGGEVAPPPPGLIEWVRIPGGTFQMGSNDGVDNERPVHEVHVPTFEMARTEVTVAQYRAFVKRHEHGTIVAPRSRLKFPRPVLG